MAPEIMPTSHRRDGPPPGDHPGRGSPVTPPVPPLNTAPAPNPLKSPVRKISADADNVVKDVANDAPNGFSTVVTIPAKKFVHLKSSTQDAHLVQEPETTPEEEVSPVPELPPLPPATPVVSRLLVRAHTEYGQSIVVQKRGGVHGTPLHCLHAGLWQGDSRFAADESLSIRLGVSTDGIAQVSWQSAWRSLPIPSSVRRGPVLVLEDADDSDDDAVFQTAAFTDVVFRRQNPESQQDAMKTRTDAVKTAADTAAVAVVFGVRATRVAPGDAVYVVGDCDELGAGDNSKAVRLSDADAPVWSACIPISSATAHRSMHYRFIVRDLETGAVRVEENATHELCVADHEWDYLSSTESGYAPVVIAYVNAPFRYATKWRGAGVALPVFSIRTRNSCGVGEFSDLPRVVDFCVATGHQLLQLLPVNDTTSFNNARDSYPYSAVSCFALHPQYMNLESLGEMPDELYVEFQMQRDRLNALPEIDYEEVMRVKQGIIRRMYGLQKDEFLKSSDFLKWYKEQSAWLVPYALFRFFMEINGTAEFDRWGNRASVTPDEMEALADSKSFHFDYLGVVYYTQYHLHLQLSSASKYAAEHGVVFKGDLPIGVNRYCADTWLNPHLFRLNMQAGAPPDYFSEGGQNWGFPTYDWEAMSKDGYAWWRERLSHMAKYFHAYRIDHILGFFRIWEIPSGFRTGMSGRFRPVHAISKGELEMRGLWDLDRLTMPYVHDGLLMGAFGDEWWKIKDRFFEACHGRLKFKTEFDTEVKVENALKVEKDAPEHERNFNQHIKNVLFGLLNNVCLLRDKDNADCFHPRFMIERTSSFNELGSDDWKNKLREVYQDYFYNRQEDLWRASALQKLPMMKDSSNMLVCGEDLGFMPRCVAEVLGRMKILSLAVQRMPEGDIEFGIPSEYKYECVGSTSSHDISTLRGWWEEMDSGRRQRYWEHVLHRGGGAPEVCNTDIVEIILSQHLSSPAMWIITPIQDLLGMDAEIRRANAKEEQINDPSNSEHIWCFRLHRDIDSIMLRTRLIENIAEMNKRYSRGAAY